MPKKNKPTSDGVFWQEVSRKRKKRIVGNLLTVSLCLLVLAALCALLWHKNQFGITLQLLGEETVTMEYGSSFEDPGAAAYFSGKLLHKDGQPVDVTVTGAVDPVQIGTYELHYTGEYMLDLLVTELKFSQSKTRIVHVVDSTPPVITLHSSDTVTLDYGQAYREDGFQAWDACDGDVTDRVKCEIKPDSIWYTVSDLAGNTSTVIRKLEYRDVKAPELTLMGSASYEIDQWGAFTDPGVKAFDDQDGDITHLVQVHGEVNYGIAGMYILHYSVADSHGNTSTATRTVRVRQRADMAQGDTGLPNTTDEKVIYLTFDDGPGDHTPRLLRILEHYNVKATFFVVNTGCVKLVSQIAQAGHTVAMHSYSHKYDQIYSSVNNYLEDLQEIQNVVQEHTGELSTILRFPGGSSNTTSKNYSKGIMSELTKRVKEMGYRYFDWNVDSHDAANAKSREEVLRNVIGGISSKNVAVVLQHDIFGYSVDAVGDIIQWGLRNGYTFKALDASAPICEHRVNN